MNHTELRRALAAMPDDARQIIIRDRRGTVVYFTTSNPGRWKAVPNPTINGKPMYDGWRYAINAADV